MKARFAAVLTAVMILPVLGFASPCNAPTVVPADGRIVDFDFVGPSTSNFYQFSATSGHSYSVEVRQDYDDVNGDLAVTLSGTAGSCPTPAVLAGTNDTTASEPALPSNASRLSFTATGTGIHRIQVANGNGSTGRYISVTVSETTVYNPNWSTFGTFLTQYNFLNTTSQPINGKLIVTPTFGSSLTQRVVNFVITASGTPGSRVGITAGPGFDADIPKDSAGYAIFTHDGPPGGLLTQAQFLNGNATVIVPTKFEAVRLTK